MMMIFFNRQQMIRSSHLILIWNPSFVMIPIKEPSISFWVFFFHSIFSCISQSIVKFLLLILCWFVLSAASIEKSHARVISIGTEINVWLLEIIPKPIERERIQKCVLFSNNRRLERNGKKWSRRFHNFSFCFSVVTSPRKTKFKHTKLDHVLNALNQNWLNAKSS